MDREDIERIRALEEQVKSNDKALKIQSKQNEQRFRDLDYIYARNEKILSEYPNKKELIQINNKVDDRLDSLMNRVSKIEGRTTGRGTASGSIYAVIAMVLALLALLKGFF